MPAAIKKGDTVQVLTGKEKGKKGRVLSVHPSENKVIIEKINVVKKHLKPSRQHQQGGIVERENPLHISNVMLVCPKCQARTRSGVLAAEDAGKRLRVCKKCKEVID